MVTKKNLNILVLAWVIVSAGLVPAWALTNGVKYTVHNIGATTKGSMGSFSPGDTTEVCVFCHTPHNARAGLKFLWNRNDPNTANFMLYTSSSTLNFTKTGISIGVTSKMCMSCHDGATAMNAMANPRQATNETIGQHYPDPELGDPNNPSEFGPNLGGNSSSSTGGGDLTNDHPISFTYQSAIDNGDNTINSTDADGKSVGGLPLWLGSDGQYKVECVTCHDPHINYGYPAGKNTTPGDIGYMNGDTSLRPFLRRSNSSSNLCFTCHNK